MAFPDPEMRKFLVNGTPESTRAALSSHVAQGMEITDGDDGALILTLEDREASVHPMQQLKLTIRTANALIEQVQQRQKDKFDEAIIELALDMKEEAEKPMVIK